MTEIKDVYELSPLQQGMLFHNLYNPASESYFQQLDFRITGNLYGAYFRQAWQLIVDRYDVFRTSFHWEELDSPVQVVKKQALLPWEELDWTTVQRTTDDIQVFLDAQRQNKFQLETAPLMRCQLIKLDEKNWHFVWNYHHLLLDGWCLPLILKEVFYAYDQFCKGLQVKLPLPVPIRNYIVWLNEQDSSAMAAFWQTEFAEMETPGSLFDAPIHKRDVQQQNYSTFHQEVSPEITMLLQKIGRDARITFSTIIQAAWAIVLQRFLRQPDVLFGYTVSGRSYSVNSAENIIGLFINTLPVRIKIPKDQPLLSWLQALQLRQQEREKFSFSSLAEIKNLTGSKQNANMLETIIAFENYPIDKSFEGNIGGLAVQDIHFFEQTDFPVTLIITPGDSLHIKCIYDKALYQWGQISSLLAHFLNLLKNVSENPGASVGSLSVFDKALEKTWLYDWNNTVANNGNETVIGLFEKQVNLKGLSTAVTNGVKNYTYNEINKQANQVARSLIENGIGKNDVVAVCMDHSAEMIASVLGIMKTGATYTPIDPVYPKNRISYIIEDASCKRVIADKEYTAYFNEALLINTESCNTGKDPGYSQNVPLVTDMDDTAYILYTSGSTGSPKGVRINHHSLCNYLQWAVKKYLKEEKASFPLYTSISFDLTVTSLFVPLISGNSIVVYSAASHEGPLIGKILDDDLVTVIKTTPSHLKLVREKEISNIHLKRFIVGGEELETGLARDITRQFEGRVEIYNEYGPTEATVGCMIHQYTAADNIYHSVPVGKPVDNTQIYILDENLNPSPVGIAGELCIAGYGLAQGYHNNEALTSERFVESRSLSGKRIYRSGDLARFQETGNLELLGRLDRQVKWRGLRIELDEVGEVIKKHSLVTDCVVELLPVQKPVKAASEIIYCSRCGLPSNYPDVVIKENQVCEVCTAFESYKDRAGDYFRTESELISLFNEHKSTNTGRYDCLMLLSGGKDSSYVLYQLVKEYGLKVLVFSLDNGFISEGAKQNMLKMTSALGVDMIFGTTDAMNGIFVDSLREFSNVCNGCFKTIYTLSMNLAKEKGIKYIVTGLSRGQLFETRLNDLYCANIFNPKEIDELVLETRIEYHQKKDAVSENLDVSIFKDSSIFREIEYIDFFRYCDVSLEKMYAYLDEHAPWVRPSDTGRSTNCLINDVGIYIHKKERGYHNYALPYSWDVRMGHKQRDTALDELNDDIDIEKVRKILDEIGYDEDYKTGSNNKQLVAYYVATDEIKEPELRNLLKAHLPAYMVPTVFMRLKEMPLTINGKVDYKTLPHPGKIINAPGAEYVAPSNDTEEKLCGIWKEVLNREQVSVKDNLFDIGGHSLMMTLVYSRIIRVFGKKITMAEMFRYPTIALLAERIAASVEDRDELLQEPTGATAGKRRQRKTSMQHTKQKRQEFHKVDKLNEKN